MESRYNFNVVEGVESWVLSRNENYEISTFGNLRQVVMKIPGKRVSAGKKGYTFLGKAVHRMVAETFIKNPDGYRYLLAKDDDYKNCKVENLYWSRWNMKRPTYLEETITRRKSGDTK